VDEIKVIESVKNGNTNMYNILVKSYMKKIQNFIYSMVNDLDDSESLTQDTFIKAYESINKYENNGNFQGYLFKIAKNITLNFIKKSKRIKIFSSFRKPIEYEREHFTQESGESKLIENEKEIILRNALLKLKEEKRLALILKTYMNMSYKEISEITGWSISKIETLISRARADLINIIKMQENKNKIVNKVR